MCAAELHLHGRRNSRLGWHEYREEGSERCMRPADFYRQRLHGSVDSDSNGYCSADAISNRGAETRLAACLSAIALAAMKVQHTSPQFQGDGFMAFFAEDNRRCNVELLRSSRSVQRQKEDCS